MDYTNNLYKYQGIHVLSALFTVEDDKFKVLLINRKNPPQKNCWILVGGAVYNTETVDDAINREIEEKVGLKNINLKQFQIFSNPNRAPVMRMLAIGYVGVVDAKKASIIRQTEKTKDAEWFEINRMPKLGFDHEEILNEAIEFLKKQIFSTNILRALFPKEFTLPQLQKTYESILEIKLDRRNFRKKLMQLDLLTDTNKFETNKSNRPAKLYKLNKTKNEISIF